MKNPIVFQEEEEEEEKEGTQKKCLGFTSVVQGLEWRRTKGKRKEKWQKETACVGAYDDCHEYYALSSAFNEIVLGVTMSHTS